MSDRTPSAAERINALMDIHPKGYDLTLDRIENLLEKLGSPHLDIPPVIHVAGTNGKGSTVAFTRAILEAAGLAVHVHTSPHLVAWPERYRLGRKGSPGKLVDDAVLSNAIARVASANDGEPITVFEILSAVMFVLFNEHPADVCLVEVGLGGRFDATNVLKDPAACVITPISLDHEAWLGDTLGKIAFEKAGIIKRGTNVIVGPQSDEALTVIEKQARARRASLIAHGQQFQAGLENGRMIYRDDTCLMDLPLPKMPGNHQIDNAATAIAASCCFAERQGVELSEDHIATGLTHAMWPGRMQKLVDGQIVETLPSGSDVWLDGGHNPGAAAMIANFMGELATTHPRDLVMICGMLTTKDPSGYFDPLRPLSPRVITVPLPSTDAACDPEVLAEHARQCGLEATAEPSFEAALQSLANRPPCRILISGSLYLVGDALAHNGTHPS